MNDSLGKLIGAAAVAALFATTASDAAMSTMASASAMGRTHAHSGFASANVGVASHARGRITLASHSTRTPPGFRHGRKMGWHGLHHPPGWAHGRKVGWHHGTVPPGLRR
jgi:hypothetical protein